MAASRSRPRFSAGTGEAPSPFEHEAAVAEQDEVVLAQPAQELGRLVVGHLVERPVQQGGHGVEVADGNPHVRQGPPQADLHGGPVAGPHAGQEVAGAGGDGDAHEALGAEDGVQQLLHDAALLGERGEDAVHQERHIVRDDLGDRVRAAAGAGRGQAQRRLAGRPARREVRQRPGGRRQLHRIARGELADRDVGEECREQHPRGAFRKVSQGGVQHLLPHGIRAGRRAGGFWHRVLRVAAVIRQRGGPGQGRRGAAGGAALNFQHDDDARRPAGADGAGAVLRRIP
jgi:hypothetical protein